MFKQNLFKHLLSILAVVSITSFAGVGVSYAAGEEAVSAEGEGPKENTAEQQEKCEKSGGTWGGDVCKCTKANTVEKDGMCVCEDGYKLEGAEFLGEENAKCVVDENAGSGSTETPTGSDPVGAVTGIKIATKSFNDARFSYVRRDLDNTIATIRDVVSNAITNTNNIAALQSGKQTRPDDNHACEAGKTCLLVTDTSGTRNWYEIIDCVADAGLIDVGTRDSYSIGGVSLGDAECNSSNSSIGCSVANNEYWGAWSNAIVFGVSRGVDIAQTTQGAIVSLPSGIPSGDVCACNLTGYRQRNGDTLGARKNVTTDKWLVAGVSGSGCEAVCMRAFVGNFAAGQPGAKAYFNSIGNSCSADATIATEAVHFEEKFTVTTTNINANEEFFFSMGAKGTYFVNWGDGTIETIDRASATQQEFYRHTYANSGVYTIKFGGDTVGYGDGAAIAFNDYRNGQVENKIAAVGGKLGSLFPTITQSNVVVAQPSFNYTFESLDNLTEIPADLFQGVSGSTAGMFAGTFQNSGLTAIPSGLFSGVSGSAPSMFSGTFSGTDITVIPSGLFNGVSGSADSMFSNTFSETGITVIPSGLFNGVSGNADYMFSRTFAGTSIRAVPAGLFAGVSGEAFSTFSGTFKDCADLDTLPANLFSGQITGGDLFYETFAGTTDLQSIPASLFSGVNASTGKGKLMFKSTFENSGLTSIPGNLFSGVNAGVVDTSDYNGFYESTFANCTHLTGLPTNLFSGVTHAANSLFKNTFSGCTSLSGYIPASMFSGLIANGSPYSDSGVGMFSGMFANTQLLNECPSGTSQVVTGYESYWGGKVACQSN